MAVNVSTALQVLARLQEAAPAKTAAGLKQVMDLIQSLSEENAYLNAQIQEDMSVLRSAPQEIDTPSPDEPLPAESGDSLAMLGGVIEAMRAPLVAIRGRADLIEAGMLGQISAEQGQWLSAIQENTDRSFRVLDNVQRFINIRNNEVRIDWSSFIASELLEEAHDRIRDRAAAYEHEVSIQVPEVVPLARGDFYQTLIILTDLLDNALCYTAPGGQIRLSVDSLGTHVLFSVADTGIGLRPEDEPYIGQPFWRGDYHPLLREHSGAGLSLFLAKEVLALQGGELIFSGEPEVGSTFSFTLEAPPIEGDLL